MKAYEHFRDSLAFAEEAANLEHFEPAILSAILALTEAVQAGVLLLALEENQNPHYMDEWRLIWQLSQSARKPEV